MSKPRAYLTKTNKSIVVKSSTSSASIPAAVARQSNIALSAPIVASSNDARMSEYWAEEDVCPLCKSDRHLNPKLRLMISRCYHKMCESCIDRIFSLGPEPCPVCSQILRKAHFTAQTFENLGVQKEVVIRQRISKCFNKRREDFIDLPSYNDYLEEVEDITFKLIYSTDLLATEAMIKTYEAANRELILTNRSRSARESEMMQNLEEEEKREKEEMRRELARVGEEERMDRERVKKGVLASLESSTTSTSRILSQARKSTNALNLASSTAPTLRYFASLATAASSSTTTKPIDILAELNQYDSYEWLYTIKNDYENDQMETVGPDGGLDIKEVWEKAVREAVAGIWEMPLAEEVADDEMMD